MGYKFNPFSGNFDQTGSGGGGGASYIDGEVATYADLPLDGTAPLNSAWLVRTASGVWPVSRKQAGIYIRTATAGASRDADYTYAGTMPDVFSDAVLTIYDEASTTRTGQFNLGSVTAGQNRVLTWPNANGTIARTEDFASPPAIGNTTRNTVAATTMSATGAITGAVAGTTSATSGCNGFQIPVPAAGGASAVGMYGTFSNGSQRAVIFGAGTFGSTSSIADFSASGMALHDGADTGTFVAASKLTANRTYDLPDSSGTIALTNGSNSIWIAASSFIPRTTNGCGVDSRETSTNRTNWDELLFDAGADEFAQAVVVMPSNYNNGTITARFYWTASGATDGSDNVVWGIQGRAFADDDALDQAMGTAQTVQDTVIATNDMHVSAATSAVTIAGTPAAQKPILFQIYRDADATGAGGDDYSHDARLLGVEIIYTAA